MNTPAKKAKYFHNSVTNLNDIKWNWNKRNILDYLIMNCKTALHCPVTHIFMILNRTKIRRRKFWSQSWNFVNFVWLLYLHIGQIFVGQFCPTNFCPTWYLLLPQSLPPQPPLHRHFPFIHSPFLQAGLQTPMMKKIRHTSNSEKYSLQKIE